MQTERGLDRIVNFGDAVVAIAITLLVLPLLELHAGSEGVGHLLREHWFELLAFGVSFVVIGVLWRAHHRVLEFVTTYDSKLIRLQMAWLLTIAFLPFPTQLLGNDADRAADALYVGTLLASSAFLSWLTEHIRRTPELRVGAAAEDVRSGPVWITTSLFATILIVVIVTPIGMWAMFLLLLDGPIERILKHRRDRVATPVA